jgi:predicted nucleotidyltransferase
MKQHIMTDHSRAFLYRIREAIHDVEPSARVILYGSRARGDAQPESDWDILVLLDGPVEPQHTMPFHANVVREGVEL